VKKNIAAFLFVVCLILAEFSAYNALADNGTIYVARVSLLSSEMFPEEEITEPEDSPEPEEPEGPEETDKPEIPPEAEVPEEPEDDLPAILTPPRWNPPEWNPWNPWNPPLIVNPPEWQPPQPVQPQPLPPQPVPQTPAPLPIMPPPEFIQPAPTAPVPSIDASLAAYFTAIDIPPELVGVVKSIDVAVPREETRRELEAFVNTDAPYKLTPIVFEMTVEVEDGTASELEFPLLVTFPIPEGADASRFVVVTKHEGVLSYINDITVNGDGTFSVALSRFSPFAVAERANTVAVTAGDFGTVNPSGTVPLDIGEKRSFKFTPQSGFRVGAVMLDGEPAALQSDGTLVVTGNGRDRSISVSFMKIQIATQEPPAEVGEYVEIPDYTEAGEPYPPVPLAPTPPGLVSDPAIIFTPGGGFAHSDGISAQVAQGEGWSVLNLFLAIMGLFVPFVEFIASPMRRRRTRPWSKGSRLMMAFVVALGFVSCTLFTLIENHGSPYQIINSNTPLFLVLFIVPAAVFTALMVRRRNT
jgi:hypothetical protein